MKMRHHAESRQGAGRDRNEDCVLIDETCGVFAVADGLGGMPAGDLASQTAVAAIRHSLEEEGCGVMDDMNRVVKHAHQAVAEKGRTAVGSTIATTLTLAHLEAGRLKIAHVGDSFALLLRNGRGYFLTEKHTWEHTRENLLDLAPYSDDYRNALTQALGASIALPIDIAAVSVLADDRLILATDGISSVIPPVVLVDIVFRSKNPEQAVHALCRVAGELGGMDDMTAITIFIDSVF
ncbi:MAG TPA: PP2C family serine/threonine-protein phosphatase [Opitutaceae bacterium]